MIKVRHIKYISYITHIAQGIVDGLFPKSCPMCDEILPKGRDICCGCEEKLVYIIEPKCKKCGKKLENEKLEYCVDCSKNRHYFNQGIAAFLYNDKVSKSIYRFKYHNRRTYAGFYGKAIATMYGADIKKWNCHMIIPVPIHSKKKIKRGYNQAALIAKELGKNLSMPVSEKILYRVRNTKPQKEMEKATRKKNVENAFKIYENVVKYKKIILVDDIYTTGSTIDACAKELLQAGATEVYFISLSIGHGI